MQEMYTVYVLRSESINRHYVGYTSDMDRRLLEHNNNKSQKISKYSHKNGPWKLIYKEDGFATRSDAIKREKYLKSGIGRQWLKENMNK